MVLHPYDEVLVFNVHNDFVRHIELIDDKRCCTAGDDGVVAIWDVEDFKLLHTLRGHSRPIAAMHVMTRSKQDEHGGASIQYILVTSSSDHKITLWDINTGSKLQVFVDQERLAKCLSSFNKYPGYLVSGGEKLIIWNVEIGFVDSCIPNVNEDVCLMLIMMEEFVVVAIDNHIVVTKIEDNGDKKMKISFDRSSIQKLKPHREVVTSLAKIDDESFLSGSLDGVIIQWSSKHWSCLNVYNFMHRYLGEMKAYPYSVRCLHVLHQKYIIAGHGRGFTIYDASTKNVVVSEPSAHEGKITCIDVVCEKCYIATCSEDATVKLWTVVRKSDDLLDLPLHKNLNQPDPKIELVQTCSMHSSSVMKGSSVGQYKFITCGLDHQVVLWMNNFIEGLKKYSQVKKLMPY